MNLIYQNLGVLEYSIALEHQEKTLEAVQLGEDDTLMLLEHPRVITLGLNANENNILRPEAQLIQEGFQVCKIRRGGDVTYHGPGQIVGYTLFNLKKNHGGSIKQYVYELEQVFIDLLSEAYAIKATRDPINSGVFIGNNKITAIGLSVKKGVLMHGFAFNINTELSDYTAIVPCGLKDRGVTSLKSELSFDLDLEDVKEQLLKIIMDRFNFQTLTRI